MQIERGQDFRKVFTIGQTVYVRWTGGVKAFKVYSVGFQTVKCREDNAQGWAHTVEDYNLHHCFVSEKDFWNDEVSRIEMEIKRRDKEIADLELRRAKAVAAWSAL